MKLLKRLFGTPDYHEINKLSPSLFAAIRKEDFNEVERLLKRNRHLAQFGTLVTAYSPLEEASTTGNTNIVKLLLAKGASVNRSVGGASSALFFAARDGHTEVVKLLIEEGANVRGAGGLRALHAAAYKGHIELVELLLAHKADINFLTKYDTPLECAVTPLDCAVKAGHKDIVKLLRQQGAHAYDTDEILEGCERIEKPISVDESEDDIAAIFKAVLKGKTKEVRNMLNERPNLLFSSSGGETPLHLAARAGHVGLTELLLAKGAEIDAKSETGWTALHWAASSGRSDVVKLLISNGADVAVTNDFGSTPLHGAAEKGRRSAAERLLENGAEINAKDRRGRAPLHEAADRGHPDVAELLLENRADVNIKDHRGITPLLLAQRGVPTMMGLENEPVGTKYVVKEELVELIRHYGGHD